MDDPFDFLDPCFKPSKLEVGLLGANKYSLMLLSSSVRVAHFLIDMFLFDVIITKIKETGLSFYIIGSYILLFMRASYVLMPKYLVACALLMI